MNKFQNLSFISIGEFLDYLPQNELKIVEELRNLVFECIPDAKEKISYNVPFYSRNKRICFIWPSSIPWGKVENNGVKFGFTRGNLLDDYAQYLEKENREYVRSKTFFSVEEIDHKIMKDYLFEALEVDRENSK
ncbi:MAG: DUF1801 domain-containing protein [Balneolaceae bacterium]|nr:DUF1801 domain-containing protein [Balneolaceae bacterium]MBO6547511.1 DUF1801 domain-containing protein [Balneolaceae bacterium]MBO6647542.1 DUF1801 domain-containing protein [Balneolaceae bacterium]